MEHLTAEKLEKKSYGCYHIICTCHNVHNFAEYVRKKFPKIDELIYFLKHIL